jgi:uroporphyrinogen-III decarboxylase
MNNRDIMKALLQNKKIRYVPQWLMAFFNIELVQKLVPAELQYDGYAEYPKAGEYGFLPMGSDRLSKEKMFNTYIDRCAFPVGWGANAAFGHSGPGEYNKKVIEKGKNHFTVKYETGAKWEIRTDPYFVRIFDLPVNDEDDLEDILLPDPGSENRYMGIREDILWAKENGEWTVGWINGFFSGVSYFLRKYDAFLMDLVDNPDFAKKLIQKNGEWALASAAKLCEYGVDCIGFCDDLGSECSLLISPDMYRDFIWPWHRKLCGLAHNYGVAVHMHSHGAISPILKDIASAGIDILNPLDPDEGLSISEVRRIVGDRMILCGGLSKHFFSMDRDEKAVVLKSAIEYGQKYGPYILMDSGGIPENVTSCEFDWFLSMSRDLRGNRP